MKKSLKYLSILLALVLVITGCGKKAPVNLEEFVNSEENGSDVITNIVADDPNATVSIEANTMVITYMIQDEEYTEEMLVNALDSLGDTFSGIINDLETRTGIEGINN